MRRTKEDVDAALDVLCGLVCDNLPEDWELVLSLRHEELDIKLFHPETGEEIEFDDIELSTGQMIVQRVDYARVDDGLSASGWGAE